MGGALSWGQRVSTKLLAVAVATTTAVLVLTAAAVHFAKTTETAAERLHLEGFVAVERAASLQTLLEQHRRIVEAAPAEVDRKRLNFS